MQVTREELNPCTVKLEIVCDPEQVRDGFQKALKQLSKGVRIPGFRPGHAPLNLVKQSVDPERLNATAADIVIQAAYKKAIDEEKLEPYLRGSVELSEFEREEGKCTFSAKVPLRPIVELGDYTNIDVETPPMNVTDEEIDQQIEDLRRRQSKREAITDRGVQEGDVAVVNIKVDGEEGDGRNFMVIAGQTFPQLDQLISDMKIEEMRSADLTFPQNFQEKDWAGRPMHSQVTLRSLSSVKLPELDDEFAKSYSLDNVDDLKERVRAIITNAKAEQAQEFINEQILNQLLNRSKVEVPDTMWEDVANQKLSDLSRDLEQKELTLEQYAQENGMTLEQFVEAQKNEARTYVLRAQLIQDIFNKEGMKLTEKELNEELYVMARDFRMKPEELVQVLKKNNAVREVQYQALHRKVMNFLNERAEKKEVVSV